MKKIAAYILAMSALLSCAKEEQVVENDGRVVLSASVETATKAALPDGTVTDGDFMLTYYSSPDAVSVCPAVFSSSKGFPMTVDENGIYTYLRWTSVSARASDGQYSFTLDNVDDDTSAETVTLGESYAAASVTDPGVPDIVWGSVNTETQEALHFRLMHRMSMISVELEINSDRVDLDGKQVRVTLSGVLDTPSEFDRRSGQVKVSGSRTEILLHEGVLEQKESHFVVSPWIFPPQTFDESEWPVLSIEFDGRTYSGTLTRYMVTEGEEAGTPEPLTGLEQGRHMVLRARISDAAEDVPIIFMPVYVKKWEEIDNIGIIAKQQGIYTAADYASAVAAYNSEPKDEAALIKYASRDDSGVWTFYMYRSVGSSETADGMPLFKDDGFEIEFHGYTVYGFDTKEALVSGAGGTGNALRIYADIGRMPPVQTRTVLDDLGSYLSEPGFSEGDMIGFYSMRDALGDASGGYSNYPMYYSESGNYFTNEELVVDYPNNLGYTFAYYPYSSSNTDVIDIYRPDGSVEDILVAGSSQIVQGRIYFGFRHAFSMLIIIPGAGFDAAGNQEEAKVVLKTGRKAVVMKDEAGGSITLEVEDDAAAKKEFMAVRHTDVVLSEGGDVIPVCYSVILPEGAEVDYFVLTDNHGGTQRIYPGLDPLEQGWRYPVNVSMEGTAPVVWPYEILPWEDEELIELGGDYGIGSTADFENWVLLYNSYLRNLDDDGTVEGLRKYGEMTDGKWKFRLMADIDITGIFSGAASLVTELKDELDGRNYTLTGLACTLAAALSDGGAVKNLNIASADISASGTSAVGVVANVMTGGSIIDCGLSDLRIEAEGLAGALVGSATGGSLTGNSVSGLLLSAGCSPDGLTGERTGDVTVSDNLSSALIY